MTFPRVTVAEWRAQVEKELAGASFDKSLVHVNAEGLAIQPLYTEALPEAAPPGMAPFTRGASSTPSPFQICMRQNGRDTEALDEDLNGGAEALWIDGDTDLDRLFTSEKARSLSFVVDGDLSEFIDVAKRHNLSTKSLRFVLAADPLAALARGEAAASSLPDALTALGQGARTVRDHHPLAHAVLVSTLPVHAAGADDADELAVALSVGAAYLRALVDAGFEVAAAARQMAVQISVGRDTFAEIAKLRALRLCWSKLFAAAGAPEAPLALLHAVCSSRTLTTRDPWVNMLRTTTQMFAAILGGADLITPTTYDEAVAPASALGRRVARNTGLVLREESHLGRVIDPAGGSYYLESLTDALAREAWRRFRALEAAGGVAQALADGSLRERLETAWKKRSDAIAKRKEPITGVSEFANLDEKMLPRPDDHDPESGNEERESAGHDALATHRDAEAFEALRDRADRLAATGHAPSVALITLGPPAEHRARLGFASGFFAAGGIRAQSTTETAGGIACLCGSDERYAAEAVSRARELKAAGCARVLLAGRPGPLEPALREAGIDAFIYVGCDVVTILGNILGAQS